MAQENLPRWMATARETAAALGLADVRARVVVAIEVTRSMGPIYGAQVVDSLVPALCALPLDPDGGGIPAYAFGDNARALRDLHPDDYAGWVGREVTRHGESGASSCRYAPVMNEVARRFFPYEWDLPARKEAVGRVVKKEQTVYPVLLAQRAHPVVCYVVTGSECEDESATAEAIRCSSRLPIFWQFVALSAPGERPTHFRFLQALDRLDNTHVDNFALCELGDTRPSDALFRALLDALPDYLGRDEVRAMLSEDGLDTRGQRPARPKLTKELDAPELAPKPAARAKPAAARPGWRFVSELHDRIHGPIAIREDDAEVPVAEPSIRRQKPSGLGGADSGGDRKPDKKQRVAGRLARIKSALTSSLDPNQSDASADDDSEPTAPPRRPQPPPRG